MYNKNFMRAFRYGSPLRKHGQEGIVCRSLVSPYRGVRALLYERR